jgi:hypothetical protein
MKKNKTQHNTTCVGHHDTQTNTNIYKNNLLIFSIIKNILLINNSVHLKSGLIREVAFSRLCLVLQGDSGLIRGRPLYLVNLSIFLIMEKINKLFL